MATIIQAPPLVPFGDSPAMTRLHKLLVAERMIWQFFASDWQEFYRLREDIRAEFGALLDKGA